MSVIIRLQRLPWTAAAGDLRQFFSGLHIPEGGVHIVGGRDGDAFIAFGTDEDARQAMMMDGKKIKDARIKLLLSSRVEMQKVIEKARSEYAGGVQTTTSAPAVSRSPSPERAKSPTCFEPQPAIRIEQTLDMAPPPYLSQALAGTFSPGKASSTALPPAQQTASVYSATAQPATAPAYSGGGAQHSAALPNPQVSAPQNAYSGYVGQYHAQTGYQAMPDAGSVDQRGQQAIGQVQGFSASYQQQQPAAYNQQQQPAAYNQQQQPAAYNQQQQPAAYNQQQQPVPYSGAIQRPFGQQAQHVPAYEGPPGYAPPQSGQQNYAVNANQPIASQIQQVNGPSPVGYSASYIAVTSGEVAAQNQFWNADGPQNQNNQNQNSSMRQQTAPNQGTLPPPPFMSPQSNQQAPTGFPPVPPGNLPLAPGRDLNENPLVTPPRDQRLLPPPNFQSRPVDVDPFVNTRVQPVPEHDLPPIMSGPVGFTPERPPPSFGGQTDANFYSPPNMAAGRLARQPSGHSLTSAPSKQEESIPGEYDRGGAGSGYHGPYGMAMRRRAMENQRNQQAQQQQSGAHGRAGFSPEPRRGVDVDQGRPKNAQDLVSDHGRRDHAFGNRMHNDQGQSFPDPVMGRSKNGPSSYSDVGRNRELDSHNRFSDRDHDARSWMHDNNRGNEDRNRAPPFQGPANTGNTGDFPMAGDAMHVPGSGMSHEAVFSSNDQRFDDRQRDNRPDGGPPPPYPGGPFDGPPRSDGFNRPPFIPPGPNFAGPGPRFGGPDNRQREGSDPRFSGGQGPPLGRHPAWQNGGPPLDFVHNGQAPGFTGNFDANRGPLGPPSGPRGPPASNRPPLPPPMGAADNPIPLFPQNRDFREEADRSYRPRFPDNRPGLPPMPNQRRYRQPLLQTPQRLPGPPTPVLLPPAPREDRRNGPAGPGDVHRRDMPLFGPSRPGGEPRRSPTLDVTMPPTIDQLHPLMPQDVPHRVSEPLQQSRPRETHPDPPAPLTQVQPAVGPGMGGSATPVNQAFSSQKRSLLGDAADFGSEHPPAKVSKKEQSPLLSSMSDTPKPPVNVSGGIDATKPLTKLDSPAARDKSPLVPEHTAERKPLLGALGQPTPIRRAEPVRPSRFEQKPPSQPVIPPPEPAKVNINSVATVPSSSCIRMSNVRDEDLRYAKVREFFRPIQIKGQLSIKLIYDRVTGQRKNQFYVRFMSNEDACRAIAIHQGRLGVLLEKISNEEFDEAEDGPPSMSPNRSPDHRPAASLADVVALVKEPKGSDQGPGRPKKSLLGSPTHSQSPDSHKSDVPAKGPFLVLVENMPFRFCEKDIQENFGGKLAVTSVVIVRSGRNSTGRAFIEFGQKQDMDYALRKNVSQIGGRTVKVHQASADKMFQLTGQRPKSARRSLLSDGDARNPTSAYGSPLHDPPDPCPPPPSAVEVVRDTCVLLTGAPPNVSTRDVLMFFDGLSIVPQTGIFVADDLRGSVYVEFRDPDDVIIALNRSKQKLCGRAVNVRSCAKVEKEYAAAAANPEPSMPASKGAPPPVNPRPGFGAASDVLSGPPPGFPPIDPTMARTIGPSGCVIAMHNLPSDVTLEEICELFSEFGIVDESVRMHYSPSGQPTGDCLLAVRLPPDAVRAVRALHMRFIRGNTLTAYVVPG